MRSIVRLSLAACLALGSIVVGAGPVAAECTFIPPLPKVSMAVATAKDLFVGDVIDEGTGTVKTPIFTVRVTEVFRGSAKVGQIRHYEYLEPNWPWANYPGGQPYPSCSVIWGRPGEHVILAIGARWPGGTVQDGTLSWYQPPTTFNTIGILEGSSREQYGSGGRQLFSIERLRELVAGLPPETDTTDAPVVTPGGAPSAILVLVLAASIGALAALRRTRSRQPR